MTLQGCFGVIVVPYEGWGGGGEVPPLGSFKLRFRLLLLDHGLRRGSSHDERK